MSKELDYNFSFESSKESFVVHGLEYCMTPGIMQLFHSSKNDFAKMILSSDKEKARYQFILTIKELDSD